MLAELVNSNQGKMDVNLAHEIGKELKLRRGNNVLVPCARNDIGWKHISPDEMQRIMDSKQIPGGLPPSTTLRKPKHSKGLR